MLLILGILSDKNEELYIQTFLKSTLTNEFSKNNKDNFSYILNILIKAIHEWQVFFREKSDISSVSLREIKRFVKFFQFFY